ncbi:MAG: asparagine synthetase B family protein, partial [Candidatus Binatia bacterium]
MVADSYSSARESTGGTHSSAGLYAQSSFPENASYLNDGIMAGIVGTPRWTDSGLASYAFDKGHAAALIRAYRRDGNDCLKHLRGSFSLGILHPLEQTVLLAVDRMGIQPLCYSIAADGTLVFGSSADAVRHHPVIDARLNPQGLYDYVYFNMIPSPVTIYSNIRKLEPGQCLILRDRKVALQFHWQPVFDRCISKSDALEEELRQLLRVSVTRCLGGRPTGTFLSGGLDSSTVAGVLSEVSDRTVPTYSIGFSEEGYDEMPYARIAAGHFVTEHHEYYVTLEDVVAAIPAIARAYDEPYGNSSAIPAYFCARLASGDGIQSLLAGDGGDELFGGNTRYAKQKTFELYHSLPAK